MKNTEEYNSEIVDNIIKAVPRVKGRIIAVNMLIASKIADRMKELDWNVGDMAFRFGMKEKNIKRILSGYYTINAEDMVKISEIMDFNLFEGIDPTKIDLRK